MFSNKPANTDIFRNNLFITDLDGTLLDGFAKVSNTSARIISDLSHRGALISVATARTPATVDPLLTHTFTTLPAIVLTGAAMWNRVHRCYQDTRLIDSEAAAGAVDALRSAGINPFIYSLSDKNMLNVFYNGTMSPREEKFANDRRGLALKRFRLNEPTGLEHYIPGTILIFAIGRADSIFEQAERLCGDSRLSISVYNDNYNPDSGIMEILACGVSKASAVMQLKEMTGARHLTVFGDNLNDLPMMAVADTSVATANAMPAVLDAADIVIGPNTEDSVARYILSTLEG